MQLLSSSLQALGAFAKLHRLPQSIADPALEAVSSLVDCVAALADPLATAADEVTSTRTARQRRLSRPELLPCASDRCAVGSCLAQCQAGALQQGLRSRWAPDPTCLPSGEHSD